MQTEKQEQGQSKFTRYVIQLEKTERETTWETILRHVEFIRGLDQQGRLVLCGPFIDYAGGMIIVHARDKADAEAIASSDPFVREGVRTFNVRTWLLGCAENNYLV